MPRAMESNAVHIVVLFVKNEKIRQIPRRDGCIAAASRRGGAARRCFTAVTTSRDRPPIPALKISPLFPVYPL